MTIGVLLVDGYITFVPTCLVTLRSPSSNKDGIYYVGGVFPMG